MSHKGFSIVELVVVIAIIGISLSIVSLNFSAYTKKAQIEKQTRELNSMVMNARLSAIHRKQRTALLFGPKQVIFKSYSSPYEDTFSPSAAEISSTRLNYEMKMQTGTTWSDLSISSTFVSFDTRGLASNNITLVITPVMYSGGYDCVVVQDARTKIGRMENVSTCRIW